MKYSLDNSNFPEEISSYFHFREITSCSLFLCIVHLIKPSYHSLLFSGTLELKQIDCVLSSLRWGTSIQSANKVLGADCGSGHQFLIAKLSPKLKKVGITTRPFWYDLNQILYDYTVEVMNRFKGLDLVDRVSEQKFLDRSL